MYVNFSHLNNKQKHTCVHVWDSSQLTLIARNETRSTSTHTHTLTQQGQLVHIRLIIIHSITMTVN